MHVPVCLMILTTMWRKRSSSFEDTHILLLVVLIYLRTLAEHVAYALSCVGL